MAISSISYQAPWVIIQMPRATSLSYQLQGAIMHQIVWAITQLLVRRANIQFHLAITYQITWAIIKYQRPKALIKYQAQKDIIGNQAPRTTTSYQM